MEMAGEGKRQGLSPGEEQYLWLHFNSKTRAEIIKAYQPLVFHIYGKLGMHLGEEGVDLISEGTVGLIQAVDNFDCNRGVPFKSYAYLRVKGAMIDYLRSQKIGIKSNELREFDFFAQLANEGHDRFNLDRLEYLFSKLGRLSTREAQIIAGLYRDGLSQRELAEILDCTPANISILHGRAISRLKRIAAEDRRQGRLAGLAWFARGAE